MMEDKIAIRINATDLSNGTYETYDYQIYEMSWEVVKNMLEVIDTLEGMEG